MVNEEARRERHAKLKQENIQLKNPSSNPVNATTSVLRSMIQFICKGQDNNPLLGRFFRRILATSMGFLLVTAVLTTYQPTEGAYAGQMADDSLSLDGYTDGNPDNTVADVMTEDGFLLKPAINSTESDRTGFSEVFMYTVEPGDTLSSIASSFNLKKETIMNENSIFNANQIKVGSKIRILPVDGLSHTVKKGDTLESLAKKYKVQKGAIIAQNQLEDETLKPDQVLIVPGATMDEPVIIASAHSGVGGASTAPSGAANYAGPKSIGRLIFPTVGTITQGYHAGHPALDIANRNHGPIYAAAAGKVIRAETSGWNGGYGNVVIIDHGNGMQTLYGHNEKVYVKVGQYVEQGQTIAWMGHTGNVRGPTGIHCHFEVRIKGVKYNPMNFF